LAFYIASNTLSSIYWAVPFGQSDLDTMMKQSQDVLEWFDNMKNPVPTWYMKDLTAANIHSIGETDKESKGCEIVKRLSKTQFNKAVLFLKTQAQDIDRAMFEYFFENKPLDEVIDVLITYQNEDGGFGKLDYDFEYPYSCLKHTESACRYIFALKDIPAEHPMIKKLIPYIIENYNRVSGEWDNLTVPPVNDYPHAPWWGHNENEPFIPKTRADLIAHYDPNTNSTLAGVLVKYSSLVPKEILDEVMGVVIDKINSGYEFGQYGMMSDVYFVNAIQDENLKKSLLKTLVGDGKLISLLDENWGTENAYKLCHWIDNPEHSYYLMYKDSVQNNFDFLINMQAEDGSWPPNWRWGETEVWERVVIRIKGVLTYYFLWTLKKFDRIEL